mmetsp:Transcript_82475/g.229925  ORF Transcript_82475/g.229925 Transcript_82475/m.229925 type:complete len:273 (+) Transcript_82475:209-1027(+)
MQRSPYDPRGLRLRKHVPSRCKLLLEVWCGPSKLAPQRQHGPWAGRCGVARVVQGLAGGSRPGSLRESERCPQRCGGGGGVGNQRKHADGDLRHGGFGRHGGGSRGGRLPKSGVFGGHRLHLPRRLPHQSASHLSPFASCCAARTLPTGADAEFLGPGWRVRLWPHHLRGSDRASSVSGCLDSDAAAAATAPQEAGPVRGGAHRRRLPSLPDPRGGQHRLPHRGARGTAVCGHVTSFAEACFAKATAPARRHGQGDGQDLAKSGPAPPPGAC